MSKSFNELKQTASTEGIGQEDGHNEKAGWLAKRIWWWLPKDAFDEKNSFRKTNWKANFNLKGKSSPKPRTEPE